MQPKEHERVPSGGRSGVSIGLALAAVAVSSALAGSFVTYRVMSSRESARARAAAAELARAGEYAATAADAAPPEVPAPVTNVLPGSKREQIFGDPAPAPYAVMPGSKFGTIVPSPPQQPAVPPPRKPGQPKK
ncbi:MAG: hypothetical protein IBJ11_11540 [Phycisphaerales bacterium]|nr:hypothetical protein [Phycisphaerales bacterium]